MADKKKDDYLTVSTYVAKLKTVLSDPSSRLTLIHDRKNDQSRQPKFTNRYTLSTLFPNEDPVIALRRELATLSANEYIETLKDSAFPKLSDFCVFSKKYQNDDVYIKIRVDYFSDKAYGSKAVLVMSFHFAEFEITNSDFPHRKIK